MKIKTVLHFTTSSTSVLIQIFWVQICGQLLVVLKMGFNHYLGISFSGKKIRNSILINFDLLLVVVVFSTRFRFADGTSNRPIFTSPPQTQPPQMPAVRIIVFFFSIFFFIFFSNFNFCSNKIQESLLALLLVFWLCLRLLARFAFVHCKNVKQTKKLNENGKSQHFIQ